MNDSLTTTLGIDRWPFSPLELPPHTYLVGGAVRDALLHRDTQRLDLDFVTPTGAIATAAALARTHQAGFVVLDPKRHIARVVFPQATVDIAEQSGPDLGADLSRRDFTVNALAYNLRQAALQDPLGGLRDLRAAQLRMISPLNLQEDPLRLLRAYRLAAQLDFTLEPHTRTTIAQLAPGLGRVAAERVLTEILYLLATPAGHLWLRRAWGDGLLKSWLPGATRGGFAKLPWVDRAATAIASRFSIPLPELPLVRLACLVDQPQVELTHLKCSRQQIRTVHIILELLPQALKADPRPAALYQLFQAAGSRLPLVATLALAHGGPQEYLQALVERFLDPGDPLAHPVPLLRGEDLHPLVSPGPVLGKLLADLMIAQVEGRVSSRPAAWEFAQGWLAERGNLSKNTPPK